MLVLLHTEPLGHELAHVAELLELLFTSRSRFSVTPLDGKHDGPVKAPVSVITPLDVGTGVLILI